jgi:hypothetical protein
MKANPTSSAGDVPIAFVYRMKKIIGQANAALGMALGKSLPAYGHPHPKPIPARGMESAELIAAP